MTALQSGNRLYKTLLPMSMDYWEENHILKGMNCVVGSKS